MENSGMEPPSADNSNLNGTVSMTDSVIAGDVNISNTTKTYIIHNNKLQRFNLTLIVIAVVFALTGMLTDAWNVQEATLLDNSATIEQGLDDQVVTTCIGDLCDTEELDLMDTAENCTKQIDELGDSASDELKTACNNFTDTANAGFLAMIFISLSIAALLVSVGLLTPIVWSGKTPLSFVKFTPFLGAALMGLGFLTWYFMLPSGTPMGETDLGESAWLVIFGIAVATFTGFSPIIFPPQYRPLGIGVRALSADDEAREFVIRESCTGNHTMSLIEDGQLFRISRAHRDHEKRHVEDLFTTKMEALLGFTHSRFDWLDKTQYLWNFMAVAGLVLTIVAEVDTLLFYSNWFILLFAIGLVLSLFQYADPELLTFETNTGKYRLLIYRAGSNRPLTNASMDHIDATMRTTLRGEEIDPAALNSIAESIESEAIEARRAKEEETAAQQQALLAHQAAMQAQAQAQAEMQAQALAQAQAQATIQAQQATPPPAPQPQTPAPTTPPPAAAPTPVPPITNPPPVTPTPSIQPNTPAPTTPSPAAVPAPMPPPQAIAPLPPLPPNLDPGLVSGMEIPTETIGDAPEVPMQAAPRDESLSEGEKEDLLSDLDDD
ncbi:MAG: hypothetical protein QF454_00865 [Candidatus Thalassarchaeaceae archaeon]|nr:hypothetical protein [Candidatus Thalassarchaeaceae archaeon]